MKKFTISLIVFLSLARMAHAQTGTQNVGSTYQTWITTYDVPGVQSIGVLYEVKDSTITLSGCAETQKGPRGFPGMKKYDIRSGDSQKSSSVRPGMKIFDVSSIDVIKIRKNGNTGQGILFGAISGLVVGGALGILYASTAKKNDEGANEIERTFNSGASSVQIAVTSVLIGIGCIGTGIGVGAIIGSAKITIPIQGIQEQFIQNKSMLNDYSAKNNIRLESKSFSTLKDIVRDIDGNTYPVLALGAQVWMAEDLNVSHYRDGSEIGNVIRKGPGAGNQYDWSAASNSRKLCPTGWHIPSQAEWSSLYNSLGGENGAVGKLKENFSSLGQESLWWSSTEQDSENGKGFYMNNETSVIMFINQTKSSSLMVRCIRDF